MKILSKMLSKKIDPQDPAEFERLQEELSPHADDTGRTNASRSRDAMFADPDKPIKRKSDEPEVAASGWEGGDWDDDWDDDDDWGDEDLDPEEHRASEDKQHLVSEIREAMVSVSHVKPDRPTSSRSANPSSDWADDDDFGRRARARSQLTAATDDAEDRILEKTEDVMSDRETSRRRSAMAHMKAAAAATKADRVLRHVASRDPSADPEEQSPYRDDLAKVVRPHSTSRPISRQVSRPNAPSPVWDQGAGDEDAALYAATEDGIEDMSASSIENELSAAEAERLARTPAALSEEDFAEDDGLASEQTVENDFPASRFATDDDVGADAGAFGNFEEDDFADEEDEFEFADGDAAAEEPLSEPFVDDVQDSFEDDDYDDDFAPRPSTVVSEAVAFANAPDEEIEQPEEEVRKKIWEMADEVATEVESVRRETPPIAEEPPVVEPEPAAPIAEDFGQIATAVSGRSAGRVKTRLLGFQADDGQDIFEKSAAKTAVSKGADSAAHSMFPAGWIVVIEGPGRGACFTLLTGVSQIGRGEDQAVRLDFGDTSISRNNHAAVAYDDEQGKFFLGHGGKSNLVRKNGMPVLSTEELKSGDKIRIGETALKFVSLCGEDFTWSGQGDNTANA